MLCITNLRESVCPSLLHRQFVLFVNTVLFTYSAKVAKPCEKCKVCLVFLQRVEFIFLRDKSIGCVKLLIRGIKVK